jgi:hypothetical protein
MVTKSNLTRISFVLFFFSSFAVCQEADDQFPTRVDSNAELKAKKRKIDANKHLLSFYGVNNQYPLIIKDPSLLLADEIFKGLPPSFGRRLGWTVDALFINYQYTLPKNFFVESGFQYLKYWSNFRTDKWIAEYYDNLGGFSTLSFSIGTGYRFVGENNLRFFDFHTGFTLGITDNKVGTGQSYSDSFPYQDGSGNVGIVNYLVEYRIKSRTCLGFYLGLSKDIRITKNLFATARYHYQFGKNSELTDHFIQYNIPTLGINEVVRASSTAKGQLVGVGLRWLFDKE